MTLADLSKVRVDTAVQCLFYVVAAGTFTGILVHELLAAIVHGIRNLLELTEELDRG